MLVLSRVQNEAVDIFLNGQLIGSVYVVETRSDKTRLGFQFPREYVVDRREVSLAKARKKATGEDQPTKEIRENLQEQQKLKRQNPLTGPGPQEEG